MSAEETYKIDKTVMAEIISSEETTNDSMKKPPPDKTPIKPKGEEPKGAGSGAELSGDSDVEGGEEGEKGDILELEEILRACNDIGGTTQLSGEEGGTFDVCTYVL